MLITLWHDIDTLITGSKKKVCLQFEMEEVFGKEESRKEVLGGLNMGLFFTL
jgi:hypothetical protein